MSFSGRYLENDFIFIPCFGLNVIPASSSIRWLSTMRIFHCLEIEAIAMMPSIHANVSPMHPLIPPPNGK